MQRENEKNKIPQVLIWLIDFIRKNGLEAVGIFRLSGDTTEVERIKKLYDEGKRFELDSYNDVHVISSLLKLFLRNLPEPLLTFGILTLIIKNYMMNLKI
jgi:hypothetical protein